MAEHPIPLSEPSLGGNEWAYVKECLDTNWISSAGAFVDRFERMSAERLGVSHAVAVSSGTAALHLALIVAGVRAHDEVIVPTLTFIAPVNAIRYVGAWPVFIDAEPETWQLDPLAVQEFLERRCDRRGGELVNRKTGRPVRAILPVHLLGGSTDISSIVELARNSALTVVEDACEGIGATYRGAHLGTLGDIGVLSFNGNKLVTTGGGGMVVTDRAEWARRARYLSTQARDDQIEYVHGEVGYNYRLSNVHAAIGCAQLERLDDYLRSKRAIARVYNEALSDVGGVTVMPSSPDVDCSYWLYTVLFDPERFGKDSRAVMRDLAGRGISTRPLWRPAHLNPPYTPLATGSYPTAERLYSMALSLPSSAGLRDDDQRRVINAIRSARER